MKVCPATLVKNNDLAIYQCRPAAPFLGGGDNPSVAVAPIEPVARERPRLAAVDHQDGPIAIVLDLVNPVVAPLVDRGSARAAREE